MITSKMKIVAIGVFMTGSAILSGQQAFAKNLDQSSITDTTTKPLISKQETKAECLEKSGYIWIEESKRCVKISRGSHS